MFVNTFNFINNTSLSVLSLNKFIYKWLKFLQYRDNGGQVVNKSEDLDPSTLFRIRPLKLS